MILVFITSAGFARQDYKDWVQEQNIPRRVSRIFSMKRLDQTYEFSFSINPFYLRGDFNGDAKFDIAVLIKEKYSQKSGIAIFHAGSDEVFLLGAGKKIGAGGDNFDWLGKWMVYEEITVSQGVEETPPPTLLGEAVWVEKPESAGALIYWDGETYQWYQQGD